MKRFLINTMVFLTFPMLYFGFSFGINKYIYSTQAVSIDKSNILIVGDSHLQKGINPEYFKSAQNISVPGESYILTYWKLKKVFESFIPDTIILGFSTHNISKFNELKFSNSTWSGEMFRRYYPIEQFNEISNDISIDYLTFYKVLCKETAFFPKKNHINYIGTYSNNNKSNSSNWELRINGHYYDQNKELGVSDISIKYLDSILKFCNSKGVDVVLVSPPVSENYLNNIPSSFLREYFTLKEQLRKRYIIFDKTRSSYPDSLFYDADHLNRYGAERFTNELIDSLEYVKSSGLFKMAN